MNLLMIILIILAIWIAALIFYYAWKFVKKHSNNKE